MVVVNIHSQPALERELTLLSAWFFGWSRLTSPKVWLTGIAFLALYSKWLVRPPFGAPACDDPRVSVLIKLILGAISGGP
jgi:hypothetical protein